VISISINIDKINQKKLAQSKKKSYITYVIMSEIKPFKTLKMIKETHIGLVRMNESKTKLYGVQYMLSKWERNLGDTLNIDGTKWLVGMIGDTKNDVISALNEIIKKQNSIINKKKYQQRKEEKFIMNNILNNVMKELNL